MTSNRDDSNNTQEGPFLPVINHLSFLKGKEMPEGLVVGAHYYHYYCRTINLMKQVMVMKGADLLTCGVQDVVYYAPPQAKSGLDTLYI